MFDLFFGGHNNLLALFGEVIGNCRCHIFCKVYWDSISNHLLNVSFAALKVKLFWKGLNKTTLLSSQRADSLFTAYGVIAMYFVTIRHRTVNSSDRWTRFVDAEDATTGVTAGVTIVVFKAEGVSKIVTYSHRLFSLTSIKSGIKETVFFSKDTNHEETLAFLRNTTETGIKNSERQSIASFFEQTFCFNQFVCLDNPVNIFHDKYWRFDSADDFSIIDCQITTTIIFITLSCRGKVLTRRATYNHIWR